MRVNRGKDFENEIRKAFLKCPHVSIDRFHDPGMGYIGVKNICDFGVYEYPYQYYFECKSFYGNTLNFKSQITQHQWEGLLNKSQIFGVKAGIISWFIDHDITLFADIWELEKLKLEGAKSLNIKDITENKIKYTKFPGIKKRILFTYNAEQFLKDLEGGF